MKKLIFIVSAVILSFLLTAGTVFSAATFDFEDDLYRLAGSLSDNVESGCFTAIAIRQYDKSYDLTPFGQVVASNPVPKNTVTKMKYALTLYACGITGTEYENMSKDEIEAASSTSGLVFSLHMKNCGLQTGLETGEHIDRLLAKALPSGGFPTVGTTPDIDMTAMAVQALAPYKNDEKISGVIEKALDYLSLMQTESGAFRYFGSENSENCSQVILALSSLGIDPEKDERFIKNGVSVCDALLSYRLEDGTFEHVKGGGSNATATSQAYCALVNAKRLLPFYVIDAPEQTAAYKESSNGDLTVILIISVCAVCVVICAVMLITGKRRIIDYVIVILIASGVSVYIGINGVKTGQGYFEQEENVKITGYITVSVDCSLVSDQTMIEPCTLGIPDGETAYSALIRACRQNKLTVVNSGSKLSPYITGIGDLYESQYSETSGWAYKVNGVVPSVGSGSYKLKDGDVLIWFYVPDLQYLGE